MTALLIICTACLLGYILYSVFPKHAVLPYIPSIVYAFGGAYFIILSFAVVGRFKAELQLWGFILLGAALSSFVIPAWLQAQNEKK